MEGQLQQRRWLGRSSILIEWCNMYINYRSSILGPRPWPKYTTQIKRRAFARWSASNEPKKKKNMQSTRGIKCIQERRAHTFTGRYQYGGSPSITTFGWIGGYSPAYHPWNASIQYDMFRFHWLCCNFLHRINQLPYPNRVQPTSAGHSKSQGIPNVYSAKKHSLLHATQMQVRKRELSYTIRLAHIFSSQPTLPRIRIPHSPIKRIITARGDTYSGNFNQLHWPDWKSHSIPRDSIVPLVAQMWLQIQILLRRPEEKKNFWNTWIKLEKQWHLQALSSKWIGLYSPSRYFRVGFQSVRVCGCVCALSKPNPTCIVTESHSSSFRRTWNNERKQKLLAHLVVVAHNREVSWSHQQGSRFQQIGTFLGEPILCLSKTWSWR